MASESCCRSARTGPTEGLSEPIVVRIDGRRPNAGRRGRRDGVLPAGRGDDRLLEALCDAGIELVVTRHEQQAAFLAATHGRLTGRPGVAVTTLGPGATYALTGLAHATLGGFPMLHIAGQKPLRDNWEGSFQVVDLPAVAAPVTRAALRCTDPIEASTTIFAALRLAAQPRPGAVFVELPTDVARGEAGKVSIAGAVDRPAPIVDPAGELGKSSRDGRGSTSETDGPTEARCLLSRR